ncbi:hypothetical protein DFJ68_0021 [Terracoccus luteus]|uniref:Uncharacterized protein n=1 Tax=Terracoccus luteus TaxID=53356 RepID=A0A495XUX5_9MICO|nr:hypothetical protein [Terracoccus luteus]RKT76626.1 hypothetical protein DFJ68_0021 [Terracoccus luteus]
MQPLADSEHLLVYPDRDSADEVADELAAVAYEHGYAEVRVVREALAGEDDSEDHEWAVYVRVPRRSEGEDAVVAGRLAALAEQHGGWYDPQP